MTIKRPGAKARGTSTGRPIMVLLDLLGERWTLRILWELSGGRFSFRNLRERCDAVSPTLLNRRLKSLRAVDLIDLDSTGYGLTAGGNDLAKEFARLDSWAMDWAASLRASPGRKKKRGAALGRKQSLNVHSAPILDKP